MNAQARWQRIREYFEALCERPEPEWSAALDAMGAPADEAVEVLQLLRAQTRELGRVSASLAGLLQQLDNPQEWVGRSIGPWRLVSVLGSGGMGAVFLAERADQLYQRRVALKLLRHQYDELLAQRLVREWQILADLQAPGIARFYDAGVGEGGLPYLVMEYVKGIPLDQYVAELGLEARLQLFAAICRIVQGAHARLVVHCDLKPGNVLVNGDGAPMLLDFGVSRLLDNVDDAENALYASPAYASPELMEGKRVGVTSDVFSLGVILTELLAGRPLQRGDADAAQPVARASAWAQPDCRWRRRLRGDLDAIAARATALVPERRYASAEALADDVERFLARRPVRARNASRVHALWLGTRRHWQEVAVASFAVVAGLVFMWRLDAARGAAESNAAATAQVSEFLVTAFEAADPSQRHGESEMTARELLDRTAARIDADLSRSPALQARLQAVLGRAYQHLGQPRTAETLLRKGAEGLVTTEQVPQAIHAYVDLSLQLSRAGRYADALAQADRAQALAPTGTGRSQARVLQARALAYAGLGRSKDAESLLQQALAMDSGEGSQDDSVDVLLALGDVYRSMGRLDDSERWLRRVLQQTSGRQGEQSFAFQAALQSLSSTLFEQGRIDEALAVAERSLVLTKALFGDDSSHTANAESALAGQYLDLGRYRQSAQHFEHSLQVSARVDGERSRAYAGKLLAAGTMEEARGDMPRAEQLYRQSLAILQSVLGADHADTLDAEMSLARLLMRVGRTDQARAPLRHVLDVSYRRLSPEAPERTLLRLVEVEWWTRTGRYNEAEAELNWLAQTRPSMVPGAWLRWQMQSALLAERRGQRGRAVQAWREVVAMFSRLYGADSTATAKWRIVLADALAADNQLEAARVQLVRARPQLGELAPGAEFLTRMRALQARLAPMAGPVPPATATAAAVGREGESTPALAQAQGSGGGPGNAAISPGPLPAPATPPAGPVAR